MMENMNDIAFDTMFSPTTITLRLDSDVKKVQKMLISLNSSLLAPTCICYALFDRFMCILIVQSTTT